MDSSNIITNANSLDKNRKYKKNSAYNGLKNEKLSPQSFLKNLYIDVPLVKKRSKVSDEDFDIPEMHEHELFVKNNYNVKQLKAICKYYNLKVSGNKGELYHRIYNAMRFYVPVIRIQKIWRGYSFRKFLYARGPAVIKRKICLNSEDFVTLDSIDKIPINQFFSFEQKGHIYGFDLCSLINYIKSHNGRKQNPYNREEFPFFKDPPFPCVADNKYIGTISQYIVKLVQVSNRRYKMNVKITVEDDTLTMNKEERQKHRLLSLFQKINELGHYSDSSWFVNLNRSRIITFLKELHDIWLYRAQLGQSLRRQVVPPNGNPFINTINIFQTHTLPLEHLREAAIIVMEKLCTSGQTQEDKYLGSSHVLTALTLVSNEAAQAMPWFYQSVA